TINDVMVTVISGGLDRYLRHHHDQQAERAGEPAPVGTSPLPTTVRLSAVCVVNIRPAPGLQEISSMLAGRSKARWGNCLGTFLLPLPVQSPALTKDLLTRNGNSHSKGSNGAQGVNGKPKSQQATGEAEGMVQSKEGGAAGEVEKRRLRMVASMCASKRQSLEAHYNYVNARLVLATAGMKSACTLMGRLLDQTTLSFSNMMGPVEEVSLGGHVIERISPTVLGQPHPGLGGHIIEHISPTIVGQPGLGGHIIEHISPTIVGQPGLGGHIIEHISPTIVGQPGLGGHIIKHISPTIVGQPGLGGHIIEHISPTIVGQPGLGGHIIEHISPPIVGQPHVSHVSSVSDL
ncbi:unnamed protein product, partial [Closterium sp. NIES-53]